MECLWRIACSPLGIAAVERVAPTRCRRGIRLRARVGRDRSHCWRGGRLGRDCPGAMAPHAALARLELAGDGDPRARGGVVVSRPSG